MEKLSISCLGQWDPFRKGWTGGRIGYSLCHFWRHSWHWGYSGASSGGNTQDGPSLPTNQKQVIQELADACRSGPVILCLAPEEPEEIIGLAALSVCEPSTTSLSQDCRSLSLRLHTQHLSTVVHLPLKVEGGGLALLGVLRRPHSLWVSGCSVAGSRVSSRSCIGRIAPDVQKRFRPVTRLRRSRPHR